MTFLDEIEARANKATPGPWKYDKNFGVKCDYPSRRDPEWTDYIAKIKHNWIAQPMDFPFVGKELDNGDFIANSRTDIPKLCEALRKAVEMAEFYCSEDNWRSQDYLFDSSEINIDEGKKAREFLAWLEEQK